MAAGAAIGRTLGAIIGVTSTPDFIWPLTLPLALGVSAAIACYLPIRRIVRQVGLTAVLRAE
jgi:hypothetical protein